MQANLENSAVATGLEKLSFHSNPKENQCQRIFKLLHNRTHLTSYQYCWKFSTQGFNSTWTANFHMFKLDLEKAEQPEIKLPTSVGSLKKQESSRKKKHLFWLYWLHQSLWLHRSQQTRKFIKRWKYWPPYLPTEKSVCRSRSNS